MNRLIKALYDKILKYCLKLFIGFLFGWIFFTNLLTYSLVLNLKAIGLIIKWFSKFFIYYKSKAE